MRKIFWSIKQTGSSRQKLLHLALIGILIVAAVAIAGVFLRASIEAAASGRAQSQKPVVIPQNVSFTIYPEGIHPATATVQKGAISIAIEDLAGTENGVVIERVNGSGRAVVGNVKRFERNWRGRAQVELTPGVYRLRVPDRQIEEAQITVEP